MISSSALNRSRRLGLALLLLAVPACGLTDYEALMRETQEREERFLAEQKYLDQPVLIPTQKDKDDRDVPLANLFFQPPKGINSKPQQRGMMWRYSATGQSDFSAVDMAFAEDNKDFSRNVLDNYGRADQAPVSPRQITAPGQKTPMVFDVWEFSGAQERYSVNILRGSAKPVAIVYIYNKAKADSVGKVIELSLQSLGVDQNYGAARQRYDQKSPWKLKAQPSP